MKYKIKVKVESSVWQEVGGKVLDQVEQVIEFQIVNQVKFEICFELLWRNNEK